MALLVLLQFDDEEEGLNLAEEMEDKGLKGIFKMPTQFHESGDHPETPARFLRGKTYGWMVCATCKKPSRAYWESVFQHCSYGINIKDRYFE